MQYSSNGCIYTLDEPLTNGLPTSGTQTIYPYAMSTTTGQLTQTTNSTIALPTAAATSVNVGGNYVYVTDAGSTVGGPGSILPYTQGTACSLVAGNGRHGDEPSDHFEPDPDADGDRHGRQLPVRGEPLERELELCQ